MLTSPVAPADSFYTVTLGNLIGAAGIMVTVVIALQKIGKDRKEEYRALIKEQTEMHTENRMRLDALLKFQNAQEEINRKRDHAINELKNQTSMLAEITKGFDRRLQMLEDRRRTPRE